VKRSRGLFRPQILSWNTRGKWLSVFALATALSLGVASPASAVSALMVQPSSGPAGSLVRVSGSGFFVNMCEDRVGVVFVDNGGTNTFLGYASPSPNGTFRVLGHIPAGAATGVGTFYATLLYFNILIRRCYPNSASVQFTVT
jgi:hypothetical protein